MRQHSHPHDRLATLRASLLAFREDNDSVETFLQALQGNKDKLVQQSFLSCMSHLANTFILPV